MYRVSVNFASGHENYDFYSFATAMEAYHYVRDKIFSSGEEILGAKISSLNANNEIELKVCGIVF